MADNTTLLQSLINPQVMADMISAELENKLRATQFYRVDRSLVGRAGDTITVPTWKYIGAAEDLAENKQGNVTEMDTDDVSYTVKKAVKNVRLTDEAVLSGYGDPVGEATRQLRMSIQDKMEIDGISLLEAITPQIGHVHQFVGTANDFYDNIIDAMDLMAKDNEEQGINAFLLANSTTIKSIRKSEKFTERPTMLGDQTIRTGVIGQIAGCQVLISNRVSDKRSYILTPQCLTAFMKRDVTVEQEREMLYKRTIIGSDCHYVIAIEDYDKIVVIQQS